MLIIFKVVKVIKFQEGNLMWMNSKIKKTIKI